jgi:hypothetical protein
MNQDLGRSEYGGTRRGRVAAATFIAALLISAAVACRHTYFAPGVIVSLTDDDLRAGEACTAGDLKACETYGGALWRARKRLLAHATDDSKDTRLLALEAQVAFARACNNWEGRIASCGVLALQDDLWLSDEQNGTPDPEETKLRQRLSALRWKAVGDRVVVVDTQATGLRPEWRVAMPFRAGVHLYVEALVGSFGIVDLYEQRPTMSSTERWGRIPADALATREVAARLAKLAALAETSRPMSTYETVMSDGRELDELEGAVESFAGSEPQVVAAKERLLGEIAQRRAEVTGMRTQWDRIGPFIDRTLRIEGGTIRLTAKNWQDYVRLAEGDAVGMAQSLDPKWWADFAKLSGYQRDAAAAQFNSDWHEAILLAAKVLGDMSFVAPIKARIVYKGGHFYLLVGREDASFLSLPSPVPEPRDCRRWDDVRGWIADSTECKIAMLGPSYSMNPRCYVADEAQLGFEGQTPSTITMGAWPKLERVRDQCFVLLDEMPASLKTRIDAELNKSVLVRWRWTGLTKPTALQCPIGAQGFLRATEYAVPDTIALDFIDKDGARLWSLE